jgi:beta-phosphoglucomutase-like phosphatase (HAD superfamily)
MNQEMNILSEIENLKPECLIFDCDLVIDTFEVLSKAWDDVCELYSFQKLNVTAQRKLFQKNPKDIAKIFISRGQNSFHL